MRHARAHRQPARRSFGRHRLAFALLDPEPGGLVERPQRNALADRHRVAVEGGVAEASLQVLGDDEPDRGGAEEVQADEEGAVGEGALREEGEGDHGLAAATLVGAFPEDPSEQQQPSGRQGEPAQDAVRGADEGHEDEKDRDAEEDHADRVQVEASTTAASTVRRGRDGRDLGAGPGGGRQDARGGAGAAEGKVVINGGLYTLLRRQPPSLHMLDKRFEAEAAGASTGGSAHA